MHPRIAVVIPCYRVRDRVCDVLAQIGPEVDHIYCVDDACPDGTGQMLQKVVKDERVRIIFHEQNEGVGSATLSGYRAALRDGATIIVKIDGDGQMDPSLIHLFARPILDGKADYTKGNRFFRLEDVRSMPRSRVIGNAALSFLSKISSGYWATVDPTNGYTAIHASVAESLPFEKINRGYFFESDIIFHLYNLRAVITEVPMKAVYGPVKSSLKISRIIIPFALNHVTNFFKRVFYNYYLRDFNIASIELAIGSIALTFGVIFGIYHWIDSAGAGIVASAGTVMTAALPIILGVQFLIGFLNYDIQNAPRNVLHQLMETPATRDIGSTHSMPGRDAEHQDTQRDAAPLDQR